MSNIRAALSAAVISVAASAGWQVPASAAGLPAVAQPDSIRHLAQAQRRGEGSQNEEEERKGRRDGRGGERREAPPRRAEPPKDARPNVRATPARREDDQSKRREAPRIEARPPFCRRSSTRIAAMPARNGATIAGMHGTTAATSAAR